MKPNIYTIENNRDDAALDAMALRLVRGLTLYPYFVVIEGFEVADQPDALQRITRLIANLPGPEGAVEPNHKISASRVEYNEQAAAHPAKATDDRRMVIEHPPHTDSSYMDTPHEMVGLQMVQADPDGGEYQLIPIEDILHGLDPDFVQLLNEPVYPHGEIDQSIIYGSLSDPRICYYAHQVRTAASLQSKSLPRSNGLALTAMDHIIEELKGLHTHKLKPGQILLINNTKLLHSNTPYAVDSGRLLYRIRQHIPALSAAKSKLDQFAEAPSQTAATKTVLDGVSGNFDKSEMSALDSGTLEKGMQEGSFDRAIKFCDAFLKENPKDPTALMLQARVYSNNHRQMDALGPLEIARKAQPNNPEVLKAYGLQLVRVGEFIEAKSVFEKLFRIAPKDYDGGINYSAVLNKVGERKLGREVLEKVVADNPVHKSSIGAGRKPTVLRLRGLQSASFEIVHNDQGFYETQLHGGHFAVENLFNEQNFDAVVFNILNDNLNRVGRLPNCDVVLNTVGCPDLERKSLMTIANFSDRFPEVPQINNSRQVMQTTRNRMALLTQGIEGVHYPQSERITWRGGSTEDVCKNLSALGFRYPMILRPINTNAKVSVRRVDHQMDTAHYFSNAKPGSAHYAIQYEDLRGPHDLYNRIRMYCIDGNFYPSSNLFSDNWLLDEDDRYSAMVCHSWTQLDEMSFLDDPIAYLGSEAYLKLRHIHDVVGLDFFGIDFHPLPDGDLFIYRISATMRHSFDHVAEFPYAEPHQQRITNAFETMMQRRIKSGRDISPNLPIAAA